jgi:hypothetical protein
MAEQLIPRAKARAITAELKGAVEEVFAKHGLQAPKIHTTYGDVYRVKLEAVPLAEGPNGVNLNSKEAKAFLAWPEEYGLTKEHLGGIWSYGAQEYVFQGVSTRAPKRPLVFKRVSDGQEVRATTNAAAQITPPVLIDSTGARVS